MCRVKNRILPKILFFDSARFFYEYYQYLYILVRPSWDEIREMILTGEFFDVEVVENMELRKFTGEEIKNLFISPSEVSNEVEAEMRESVRDEISDVIGKDLDKVCEIRRLESEIFDGSVEYTNTVSTESDYRMAVLDDLENCFWDCPEELKGKSSLTLLDGEINHFYEIFDSRLYAPDYQVSDKEKEFCSAVSHLLSDNELDKAVDVLSHFSDTGEVKKIIDR